MCRGGTGPVSFLWLDHWAGAALKACPLPGVQGEDVLSSLGSHGRDLWGPMTGGAEKLSVNR